MLGDSQVQRVVMIAIHVRQVDTEFVYGWFKRHGGNLLKMGIRLYYVITS
ncbi:hypothetical protein VIBNIMADA3020_790024 [Vibrio nigripulchritudo MADA3020]|nr:hypothetical protein VIBNIMADA3020_790024 [Vibrio nigripulchritudo MADA3020]CCN54710.1 hypothetical protein VIBNIMADA3021_570024 [Vibrio nigripulchritudo MADA3021]